MHIKNESVGVITHLLLSTTLLNETKIISLGSSIS